MRSPDRPATAPDVVGHLAIVADGSPLRIDFRGATIDVAFPDLRSVYRLRARLTRDRRRAWTDSLRAMMAASGLELRVLVRGREVARLSGRSKAGWLPALLGVGPVQLGYLAIARNLLDRSPPPPPPDA